jgi:hypothetical protein
MTWRPPDREDRQVAALWAVCAGLVLLFRPVWLAAAGLLPSCPWHAWTGWPCPGCGSTRAIVRLLHGDLRGAIAMNPLTVLAASAFVVGGLIAPVWLACGGPALTLAGRLRPRALALVAGAALANWAWLAASGV